MKKENMLEALEQIHTYLHKFSDADLELVPNQALRLQNALEEIIAELGAAQITWKP